MTADRYPLWCIDDGDRSSESRYRGPFETEDEARAVLEKLDAETKGQNRLHMRRCRRVLVSELDLAEHVLDDLVDRFDESAAEGGVPNHAWGNWDNPLVVHAIGVTEDVEARLAELLYLLDHSLRTRMHICQGDEP